MGRSSTGRDDAVVHYVNQQQARYLLTAITERPEQVGLQLHPARTKIVYCKDALNKISGEARP